MRKLTPKDYDETEFNKFVFTQTGNVRSHLNLMTTDITNVKSRFTNYQSYKKTLEYLENSSPSIFQTSNLNDSLFGLYDSASQDTKNLKEAIQKISEIKCPYCGIDTPSHLDHFLPRSKFPEFSIFTPNLIYVCSICNSKYKGDDVVNVAGERKFFNPYFDDFIDSIQFLKCEILVGTSTYPEFRFYIDSSCSTTNGYGYKIIKNHFDYMELQPRYMEQIAKEKFVRFKNRYIGKDVSLDKLKENIEYELGGLSDLNDNNWEKVFLESLKDSDECLMLIVDKKIT